MKKNNLFIIFFSCVAALFISWSEALCTEPVMSDYTAFPIFQTSSVEPNIMVLLDNSGSMNFCAYGEFQGSSGQEATGSYNGYGYNTSTATSNIQTSIAAPSDDAQEMSTTITYKTVVDYLEYKKKSGVWGWYTMSSPPATTTTTTTYSNSIVNDGNPLNLGYTYNKVAPTPTTVDTDSTHRTRTTITTETATTYTNGLRFQNIEIPVGAKILSAIIKFKAYTTISTTTSLGIKGLVDATDEDPNTFGTTYGDVSGRATSSASVGWSLSSSWTAGNLYDSPDIKSIITELIGRSGWASGHSMAFKVSFSGTAGTSNANRDAYTFDNNVDYAATLYVTYSTTEASTTHTTYYGYFNPEYFYKYVSGTTPMFKHAYKKKSYNSTTGVWTVTPAGSTTETTLTESNFTTEGLWDGNWMNWLAMRRFDVLKKVLTGGASYTSGTDLYVSGDLDSASGQNRTYYKKFDATSGPAVSPKGKVSCYYGLQKGYMGVSTSSGSTAISNMDYKLNIKKVATYDTEDFDDVGNLAGVLQRIGNRARWGYMRLNTGYDSSNGGTVVNKVGTSITDIATSVSNEVAKTSTPLAEAFYVGMKHFMQQKVEDSVSDDYPSGCTLYSDSSTTDDPYYDSSGNAAPCRKSFVILLTDGASNYDTVIPDGTDHSVNYKNYVNLTIVGGSSVPGGVDADIVTGCDETKYGSVCDYSSSGTYYLRDLAYYAHINDLRSTTLGKNALDGMQNLTLYTVLAFGGSGSTEDVFAQNNLMSAAKYGGFNDKNAPANTTGYIPKPDLQSEWDADKDGVPDNYFAASDGYEIQSQLLNAINDILKRAASGTAVSVLATSSEGEGNLIQAYFKPVIPSGLDEVKWGGYIQSLWVDSKGNLREDTNGNYGLDVDSDKVIKYITDKDGNTTISRWAVSSTKPYPDTDSASKTYDAPADTNLDLSDVHPIWEGGKLLAKRDPDARKIFTYIDKDNNKEIDEDSPQAPFDSNGELVAFSTSSLSVLTPYLGVKDNTTWSYMGTSESIRAENLINYIRGKDITGFRTRTLPIDGTNAVWKLGDIIHSTPVSVSKPTDNYHVIYSDQDYGTYYKNNLNRETVIYVGANDGMLHAFTSGVFNSSTKKYAPKLSTSEALGDELWAYIPQAVLPHLKWLADPKYTHVYYCDLKPKVFDAEIEIDGVTKWQTFLLLGLNLGGRDISVTADFNYDGTSVTRTYSSSYTLLNITDPRNPTVLWEKTYNGLGLTSSTPAVVKVKEKWFLVFGSGPSSSPSVISTYGEGSSITNGRVYVVDLGTGNPYQDSSGDDWLFSTADQKAFMNSPVSLDKDVDYSVDDIYFGETYDTSTTTSHTWKGKLYKIAVPWVDSSGNYDGDNTTPDKAHHSDIPNDTTDTYKKWKFSCLFDAQKPITSPVALSVDSLGNTWVFVGSGRYLSTADKTTTADTQYMFGVKDPFYNKAKYSTGSPIYYHNYNVTTPKTVQTTDLLLSDPYLVLDNKDIYLDTNGNGQLDSGEYTVYNKFGTWSDLVALAQTKDGWMRSLKIPGERIVTKFTILGGIVFTPSFVPATTTCGFGGDSYLYGQYYETGTAYYGAGLATYQLMSGSTVLATQMLDKTSLGKGLASSVGVHVGAEGAKGFIQTSSGGISEEGLKTATTIKSGLTSWREK